jgi:hypothetical protein
MMTPEEYKKQIEDAMEDAAIDLHKVFPNIPIMECRYIVARELNLL